MIASALQLDLDIIEFHIQKIIANGNDQDYKATIDYLNTKVNGLQNLIDQIPPTKCP